MTFDFHRYSFQFRAQREISFDRSGPGNWLRGAFGSALRKTACSPDCPGHAGLSVRQCGNRAGCAYARIFEPVSMNGPSGLADPPRPFVFRVAHLANRSFAPGDEFAVNVNFFDSRQLAVHEFADAFGRLAHADLAATSCTPTSIALESPIDGVTSLRVEFLTPTELKSSHSAAPAEFSTLFARARDRVSTLRAFYGTGPLEIDFRALGERAQSIRMTHSNVEGVPVQRRSARTHQVHSIGGFVGAAEYVGPIGEFLPILEAARWTGIGRHCVWGNGEIHVTVM